MDGKSILRWRLLRLTEPAAFLPSDVTGHPDHRTGLALVLFKPGLVVEEQISFDRHTIVVCFALGCPDRFAFAVIR